MLEDKQRENKDKYIDLNLNEQFGRIALRLDSQENFRRNQENKKLEYLSK